MTHFRLLDWSIVESAPETPSPLDAYWQGLVRAESSDALDQVGHTDMGRAFNRHAYTIRQRALTGALHAAGVHLPGSNIFEAGFGIGFYLNLWETAGCTVTGVDLSPTAVANVRARFPSFDLRDGDIADIDTWGDWSALKGTFDLVTAIDVLYHIVADDRAASALRNLAALVRPGGVLIFSEKFPVGDQRLAEHPHVTRRPLAWFQSGLTGMTFERSCPVFWCMDPALHSQNRSLGDYGARAIWIVIRASTKYLRSKSPLQEMAGSIVGTLGASIDRFAVGRVRSTGNMQVVTMRRQGV